MATKNSLLENNERKGPDFIGIGAAKSGTTWISQCLAEHPEIYIPIKEIDFFNNNENFNKGVIWYENIFSKSAVQQKKGEFSPDYFINRNDFESISIAQKIHLSYPKVKLIISLRNPIERAWSAYSHLKEDGFIVRKILFNKAIVKIPFIIKSGYYFINLRRWLKYFPKNQILILIYENIIENPLKFIQKVYNFLEVNNRFIPKSLKVIVLPTNNIRFSVIKKIQRLINKQILLPLKIKMISHELTFKIYNNFYVKFQIYKIIGLFYNLLNKIDYAGIKNDIPLDLKNKLQNYYKKEIEQLEKIINRQMPEWKI